MKNNFNKKGLSDVIITLLTIVLVLSIMAIIWSVTNGLIQKQINSAEKCGDLVNKININSQNTCYQASDETLQFSIDVKDISIDDILVTISETGGAKSFKFNDESIEDNVRKYEDPFGIPLVVPGKNTGTTYVAKLDIDGLGLSGEKPQSIKIAPIVSGEQCDTVDSLSEISYCIPID